MGVTTFRCVRSHASTRAAKHAVSDRTQDSWRTSQSIKIPHSRLVLFSTSASAFCVSWPVLTKLGLGRKNRILHLSLLNFVLLDWPCGSLLMGSFGFLIYSVNFQSILPWGSPSCKHASFALRLQELALGLPALPPASNLAL